MSESARVYDEPWQWFPVLVRVQFRDRYCVLTGRIYEQSQQGAEIVARWLMTVYYPDSKQVKGEWVDLELFPEQG